MAETLYRKYRPQTFADITEQGPIKKTLMQQLAKKTVAHAYVFSGPRGVGKTSMARIFAKALNCKNRKEGESEPCNTCGACTEITAGRHLDVIEIDAASNTGVDAVREHVIEAVRFQPASSPFKVFIIDEAHMLSTAAFNALLKTLEEPPAHAVFILASTELHKFPETILSRCQRLFFKKISVQEMVQTLRGICEKEGYVVAEDVLQAIARRSEGGMRDAESLLGQILILAEPGKELGLEQVLVFFPQGSQKRLVEFAEALTAKDAGRLLQLLGSLQEEGVDVYDFASGVATLLRDVLLAKVSGKDTGLAEHFDGGLLTALQGVVRQASIPELVAMAEGVSMCLPLIRKAEIPELPLELFVIRYCGGLVAVSQPAPRPAAPTPAAMPVTAASQPAAKPVAAAPSPAASSASRTLDADITSKLDVLRGQWSAVINKVGETSQSLPFILRLSNLTSAEGSVLHVAFQYPFHADTFNKEQNRRLVEDALASVTGVQCRCLGIAQEVKQDVAENPVAGVDAILQTFGGTVVT